MKKWMLVVMASALLSFIQIDRSYAATEMFLFMQGVSGEATQVPHANWIEVESASWGHATKAPFDPLVFTKVFDLASPLLALAVADGRHFQTAILEFQKPVGSQQQVYLRVILTDVTVKAYAAAGHHTSAGLPVESVKLGFAKIEWLYFKQMPNGLLSPTPARTGWDVINNKPF
ncbi:MAG: type VI secretion system tube protein Hcp [Nitrospirota bacterium]|nr:type VI secretion system tube protein Hcp [Nitrospirota bacterium]